MKFSNLKFGVRLGIGFSALMLLTCIIGIFSMERMSSINAATKDVATNWLTGTRLLGDFQVSMNLIRRAEAQHMMSVTDAQFSEQEKRIEDAKIKAAEFFKAYTDTVTSDKERQLLDAIRVAKENYLAVQVELLKLSRSTDGVTDDLRALFGGASLKAFNELLDVIQKDVDFQSQEADAAYRMSQDAYSQTMTLVVGFIVASLVIGALLSWKTTQSVTQPLHMAVQFAESVAAGDLSANITDERTDEVGALLKALSNMNSSLSSVVNTVRQGSESVATASAQIAQGNQDLSSRTESQASALEETAASMEELSTTVKQNADNARQANQLALRASQVAREGGDVVSQVVGTMKEISDSSKRISEIITVIDGIAFQTNILALNAAVEAARAGEQGRGFAVVAGEVRSLASRSAEAAKEIKQLITESVGRVDSGTALVDRAGNTMTEVVGSIQRVTDIMAEISAASVEQSAGVNQVGEAVANMDQATQQNAALVEEMAAAADTLRGQARDLVATVAVFKLDSQSSSLQKTALVPKPTANAAAAKQLNSPKAGRGESTKATVRKAVVMPTPKKAIPEEADWETF
ncbi:methyl-accepting chemotaxis protein [Massilia horti]|uniref:methyl-accepting chemotaxis protein n=1 Tax=Massilia horti TaxID=2562153 RepID=UPI001430A316|nr:methyl-accepting chemotaxis protein [Massilia horti]